MGNMAADNAAGKRINSLLDAGSFVEIVDIRNLLCMQRRFLISTIWQ